LEMLSAADILARVDGARLIPVVREGLRMVHQGDATVPERLVMNVPFPGGHGTLFAMPAFLPGLPALTVKVVTVYPNNPSRRLDTTQGTLLLLDETTGTPELLLDGGTVTWLRTGAVTALAATLMAPPGARALAVIGTGAQAAGVTEAMLGAEGLRIEEVRVHSRDAARRRSFIDRLERRLHDLGWQIPRFRDIASADEAVEGAGLVVTATTASEPVFHREALTLPCHLSAVGVFRPDAAEFDPRLVGQARAVVVESRESARREAGELVQAAEAGQFEWARARELAEVVEAGGIDRHAGGLTIFKSVGVAALDAAVARSICQP
jgi:ornithine cyclodeaminase